jgi:hypothetical protein
MYVIFAGLKYYFIKKNSKFYYKNEIRENDL